MKTSRQVYLCRWKRHLAGFSHFGVVDRLLATLKRARTAHKSLSRDRRMNMQLNTKILTSLLKIPGVNFVSVRVEKRPK